MTETTCACGHDRLRHYNGTGACNPCGASGIGEDAYPNCAEWELPEQPTAQPTEDDVAGAIFGQPDPSAAALAVLALLPGRPESVVKAEALREAAADMPYRTRKGQTMFLRTWLAERADRIAAR